jgi:predicted NUDIX family NTP pyrophosphohydrolase
MPRPESAGTLLYRTGAGGTVEVLIVHPSGAYNRKAPWSIPKGLPDAGETLEAAARRETIEETGVAVTGPLVALGHVDYTKSRKRVHAFAGPAPDDAAPRCASWECDKAEFVPVDRARALLHPEQAPFVDRLIELIGRSAQEPA